MPRDRWMQNGDGVLEDGAPTAERLIPCFQNGLYQQIFFLGASGFVICDTVDKKILLLDPWPSHYTEWVSLVPLCKKRILDSDSGHSTEKVNAISRLAALAGFLRTAVENQYELSALIISHAHMDHIDDVISLLELLRMEGETGDDRAGVEARPSGSGNHIPTLKGRPVPEEKLPPICADFDAIVYLLTYGLLIPYHDVLAGAGIDEAHYFDGRDELKKSLINRSLALPDFPTEKPDSPSWKSILRHYRFIPSLDIEDSEAWKEISGLEGERLFYNDTWNARRNPNDRLAAGEKCAEMSLGGFKISPYVWDHMNVGFGRKTNKELREQSAGDLERCTAFLIEKETAERGPVRGAKRSFFVPSMGEMNKRWTEVINERMPVIETDALFYAITRRIPADFQTQRKMREFWAALFMHFGAQIKAATAHTVRKIKVNDAFVMVHFEEFLREIASREKYKRDFQKAAPHFLDRLREIASECGDDLQRACYEALFENNRFYAMGRCGTGFENIFPESPDDLPPRPVALT